MIFILFLIGAWLTGNMMNFRFESGGEIGWEIGFGVTWISIILIFAVPAFIFYRARTKMFFMIFSVALFWLSTPIFYHVFTIFYISVIIVGFVLITLAFWKGQINKKLVLALYSIWIFLGVGVFFFFFKGFDMVGNTNKISPIWGGWFGLLLFLVTAIFAIGFFAYQKYDIMEILGLKEEEEETIEEDISSTVEKAITEIHEGKDIESTIMRCYKQMCLIFEEQGVSDEEYMTPREFEKAANEALDVSYGKTSRIREIFELARYSSHELREKDKEEVIEDLKALRDELI